MRKDEVISYPPLQVTATHQLESAVTTLALCTRPILLASPASGSPGADPMELDEVPLGAAHVGQLASGRAAIADALMHTLPGIDANDPPKTLATLQLYASVLSSVSFDSRAVQLSLTAHYSG